MQITDIDKRSPQKSFQGEGPYAGQRIVILRFMKCNMKCHWPTAMGGQAWCDTKWTWDGSEQGETWNVEKLARKVLSESRRRKPLEMWEQSGVFGSFKRAKIVMITGGEPMLRQGDVEFQKLVELMKRDGFKIHIETNGSIPPNMWAKLNIDFFDTSPKFALYPKAYTREKMKEWQECGVQTAFKFVIGTVRDVYDLHEWVQQMDIRHESDIWLMPLTNDDKDMGQAKDILSGGIDEAFRILEYKHVRISPRLQITGNFP